MQRLEWIKAYFGGNQQLFENTAAQIWTFAETKYQEHQSSDLLIRILEEEGFTIKRGIADIPTAFIASFGDGKPAIGILAEYDALPSLSQQVCAQKKPVTEGGNGHGCGHCLLGAGSLAAALAVKNYITEHPLSGTIKLFGCPAEESGGSGKVFMARSGCFHTLDAVFTWHPGDYNEVWDVSSLANYQGKFTFKGITAHAAMCPQLGRSALDSAEIMNIGANYLREHIIPEARLHYAYLNAGVPAPNVVQDYAQLHYNIRAPKLRDAKDIFNRIVNIARGSALMNGTEISYEVCGGMHEILLNDTLGAVVSEVFQQLGPPTFDSMDSELAKNFFVTFPESAKQTVKRRQKNRFQGDRLLDTDVRIYQRSDQCVQGSTDVGEVSHITPTVQFTTACVAMGTPAHSWQFTAQCGSSIGMKGMLQAGQVIATSVLHVLENPHLLETARTEFQEAVDGEYECPFPEQVMPEIGKEQL